MKQVNIPMLDLSRQHEFLMDELISSIQKIIRENAFIGGAYVDKFEENFANYCGTQYCIGVANGTDALMMALMSLGIGQGDEVITTASSFFATAEAISCVGATPVFCDIDPGTANIDTQIIEKRITAATKAIIPVHLYGQPADMEGIVDVARKHELFVVEDCAQAVGASYRDQKVGSIGDVGCFSFYPSKNLGGFGDAGAIVTNNPDVASKIRMLANHGGAKKYQHEIIGYNSRLNSIQATVLDIKLPYLDEWNAQRRHLADLYNQLFQDKNVETLRSADNVYHVYHLYAVRLQQRDKILEALRKAGIGSDVHYPEALPFLKAYKQLGHKNGDYPEAYRHSRMVLSLPIFPYMQETEVEKVAEILLEQVDKFS